jgi:hypothetical protein
MPWSDWVSTPEAHARASGRRGYNKRRQQAAQARRAEVQRLAVRWGTFAAAKVKMARALKVSVTTIARDVRAVAKDPPVPMICPTCGLPSRLEVDPSTVTDDPDELATLEQAFATLIGAIEDQARPPHRRPIARISRPTRAVAPRAP